ncbi:unannotated protein [freshwater metagenome]|uniref:Unannotated protein n=1 Tax=freshwater metagenome TaxID=449393 RepID=A0A6J7FQP9_9ZZZZ|nr:EAL domain-containing protein [Actinomycetota bacterium]
MTSDPPFADVPDLGPVVDRLTQLSQVLEGLAIAVLVTDDKAQITYANAAGQALIEALGTDSVVGRQAGTLFPGAGVPMAEITEALDAEGQWCSRITLQGFDQEQRHFVVWAGRHRDRAAGNAGWVIALSDITAQVQGEQSRTRAEEALARAEEMAHLGNWDWDLSTDVETVSAVARAIFPAGGAEPAITLAKALHRVHPDDRQRVEEALQNALSGSAVYDIEYRLQHPDGQVVHVHERARLVLDEQGQPARLVGMVRDRSDEVARIAALEKSERQLRAALDAMAAQTAVLDAAGVIASVNNSWLEFAQANGAPDRGWVGLSFLDAVDVGVATNAPGAAAVADGLREVLGGDRRRFSVDYVSSSPDGRSSWFVFSAEAIDSPTGGAVISYRDITARKHAQAELRHLELHDALTGLPNRQLILDRIQIETRRPRRSISGLAVLLVDLDRFRVFNDSLGRGVGDRVLIEVATRIIGAVRPGDMVGRVGGDEFVIICDRLHDLSDAETIATRILQGLESPLIVDDHDIYVRASIGIANNSDNDGDAEMLIRHAEAAMYAAKSRGGHRFANFDISLGQLAIERAELERDLRFAVDHGQLHLEYQPEYDLRTGVLVGVEALARWTHPVHGPIPPSVFIPIAEQSDLIDALGRWALRTACEQLATWDQTNGPPRVRVAVNVAVRQLAGHGLAEYVAALLVQYGLQPARLELEITETAFLDNLELFSEVLKEISGLGVRISLDDFGTGSASLSHVSRLPMNALKIDQSFVKGIDLDDPGALAIVKGVISIAQAFSFDVVAEGIETAEQLAVLQGLGCRYGQGYLLGRPTGPDSIETMAAQIIA